MDKEENKNLESENKEVNKSSKENNEEATSKIDLTPEDNIRELEDKAVELYLNEIEWQRIIEMLSKDEQDEYWRLVNERCGF